MSSRDAAPDEHGTGTPDNATTTPANGTAQPRELARSIPALQQGQASILRSSESFRGKIFSVYTEEVQEPNGVHATRDVVRHNGSVVVLAVDDTTDPSDPRIVLEAQFRHAANQYLYELPAGRVDAGEQTLQAAKRELIEETGYRAEHWSSLVRYYASPGFVAEWMEIFLATGIRPGEAQPEDDERIETYLVPLSELLGMARRGEIHDGKTLVGVLLYAEQRRAAGLLK